MERAEYQLYLEVSGIVIHKVVIDPHYKIKHQELSNSLILNLVWQLNGGSYFSDKTKGELTFYKVDPVMFEQNPYRLIFVINRSEKFLGVINAFRVQRKKNAKL